MSLQSGIAGVSPQGDPALGTETGPALRPETARQVPHRPRDVRRGMDQDKGRTVKLTVWNGLLPSLSRLSALT